MKRLTTLQLVPGMVVAKSVLNFDRDEILPPGTVLTDRLITKLDLYGVFTVYVEDCIPKPQEPMRPVEPSYAERIKKSPDFKQFKKDYEINIDSFRNEINNVVERNLKIDVKTLLNNALKIISNRSTTSPVGVFDMLQNMREYDDSTFTHCMNVALICNVFATWLKFTPEQIELATACGLFHDIGKLTVPHDIITKPGKLSDEEYEQIKKHPISGYQMLLDQDVDDHVRNAALMHHERSDGMGYPLHLSGNQIDMYARMVAIADVYDAMTASRCYRGPLCPFRVIEIFEQEGFQKYDVQYLYPFLHNVVNTYIQNRCRLTDGREGEIIYINKAKLSRPIVQCGTEYINLAEVSDLAIETLL